MARQVSPNDFAILDWTSRTQQFSATTSGCSWHTGGLRYQGREALGVEESGRCPQTVCCLMQTGTRIPDALPGLELLRPGPTCCSNLTVSPPAFVLSRCGRDFLSRLGQGSVTQDTVSCDIHHLSEGIWPQMRRAPGRREFGFVNLLAIRPPSSHGRRGWLRVSNENLRGGNFRRAMIAC